MQLIRAVALIGGIFLFLLRTRRHLHSDVRNHQRVVGDVRRLQHGGYLVAVLHGFVQFLDFFHQ